MFTAQELYVAFLESKRERTKAGFDMPGARAIEDVAILYDISIHQVCEAISFCREPL